MANATIFIGKHSRPLDISIQIARQDTRWHVYPGRPERWIQAIILGNVYQYSHGFWFKSCVAAIPGKEASSRLLSRIGATAALPQLQELV